MASPTLLVLAAGMGSRYGGLKQTDPVGPGGETLLDYSMYDALRAGFGKVVFVIRKEIEKAFEQRFGARLERHVAVEYVFQEVHKLLPGFSLPAGRVKPWGTTHAVLTAAFAIEEPFAVINADDFYGAASFRCLAQHLRSGSSDGAMVGFRLRDTLSDFGAVARGVCHVDEDGYLRDIVERKGIERRGRTVVDVDASGEETVLTGDEVVSMNMWGFTPQILPRLGESFRRFLREHGTEPDAECYLPVSVNEQIQAGAVRVRVLDAGESWFGVTYREDRLHAVERVRRLIEAGHYPPRLRA